MQPNRTRFPRVRRLRRANGFGASNRQDRCQPKTRGNSFGVTSSLQYLTHRQDGQRVDTRGRGSRLPRCDRGAELISSSARALAADILLASAIPCEHGNATGGARLDGMTPVPARVLGGAPDGGRPLQYSEHSGDMRLPAERPVRRQTRRHRGSFPGDDPGIAWETDPRDSEGHERKRHQGTRRVRRYGDGQFHACGVRGARHGVARQRAGARQQPRMPPQRAARANARGDGERRSCRGRF